MKTWEMIKELTDSPEKTFVSDVGKKVKMRAFISNLNLIAFEYVDGEKVEGINLDHEWEEVKQLVTWQEAIQAYAEHGKSFSVYVDGEKVFQQAIGCKVGVSKNCTYNFIDTGYILEGEWYIED